MNEPWGKDAKLLEPPPSEQPEPTTTAKVGIALVRFHQTVISPADGPRSHFVPCSSTYTLRAMKKHGFFKGVMMGCSRLMRENSAPWFYYTKEIDGCDYKIDNP